MINKDTFITDFVNAIDRYFERETDTGIVLVVSKSHQRYIATLLQNYKTRIQVFLPQHLPQTTCLYIYKTANAPMSAEPPIFALNCLNSSKMG